jgi:hypothetical protein
MKIRTAILSASVAAFIASSGFAYAAYTGQFNIVQWAGAILGAPTAPGTSATGNILGFQGVTSGVPLNVHNDGSFATGSGGGSGGSTPQATTSAPINISTATTTTLVPLISGDLIYVTSWDVISAGTGNITLEYGTGSNCGTGTTTLTGAYNLAAQAGISKGDGLGAVYIIPASNALCAVTSAAVQYSGSVSFTQSPTTITSFGGGGGSGSNASVGANASAGPSSSTQIGSVDPSGNLQPASTTNPIPVDASGKTLTVANPAAAPATGTFAPPGSAVYVGANTGNLFKGIVQAGASVVVQPNTATTTQIVGLVASNGIAVTSFDGVAPSGTWQLVYGTGTACATGTTNASIVYTGNGQQQGVGGSGLGPVIIVPTGNELCVVTSAAVQYSIRVAYSQSP